MKNHFMLNVLGGALVCSALISGNTFAGRIDQVNFKFADQKSVIDISGEGLNGFQKEQKSNPSEIVLTFKDTKISASAQKKLDLSTFNSDVIQVSVYQVQADARIVIDFKKAPSFEINSSASLVSVGVRDKGSAQGATDAITKEDSIILPHPESVLASNRESISTSIVTEQHSADPLTDYTQDKTENSFTGSPITLQLKDADVREVLRMIGDASGFNIIVHPQIQGKISLSLEQVPWDQALDVVLNTMGLGAERSKSVLRVMPRELLIAEKQNELNAKRLSSESAPRITRIFPISYAELGSLLTVLQSFLNQQTKTPGASATPGLILTDTNTNSIIVRDIAENVEKVRKMIELLDVQTAQVLIEAKVVEATDDFTRTLGGNTGLSSSKILLGFNGSDPTSLIGGLATPASIASGTTNLIGPQGFGASVGTFLSLGSASMRINAALQLSESLSQVKIVSSPKLVVISGKSARINQSETVNIQVQTTVNGALVTSFQPLVANTSLNVTPRVTNDGSVFLRLDLSRDSMNRGDGTPGSAHVDPRTMGTEVIVDSGSTIVIGGVLSLNDSSGESGVPFLRKIPLIGWLFGSENKSKSRTELMFFITPRILNPKKTGMQPAEA